ncbi:hypothetical protein SOVF_214210, partial [Spinacia oleracea]
KSRSFSPLCILQKDSPPSLSFPSLLQFRIKFLRLIEQRNSNIFRIAIQRRRNSQTNN